MPKKRFVSGVIDPVTIIGVLFLIITLGVGTYTVNKRGFSFNINERAGSKNDFLPDEDKNTNTVTTTNTQNNSFNWDNDYITGTDEEEFIEERQGDPFNQLNNNPPPAEPEEEDPADTPSIAVQPTATSVANGCSADGATYNNDVVAVYAGEGSYKKCVNGLWTDDCNQNLAGEQKCTLADVSWGAIPAYLGENHCQSINGAWLNNQCITDQNVNQQTNLAAQLDQTVQQLYSTPAPNPVGQSYCSGSTRRTWNGYGWEDTNCAGGCSNGACITTFTETDINKFGEEEVSVTSIYNFGQGNTQTVTTPIDISSYTTLEKVDDGFIRDFTTIIRNQNTNDILNVLTQSVNPQTSSSLDCGKPGLTQEQRDQCTNIARMTAYNAPIVGRYIQSFSDPNKIFQWQQLGYSSSNEAIQDCINQNGINAGYGCMKKMTGYGAEQVASSVSLGTTGTALAAVMISPLGWGTGALTGIQAISLGMAASTVYQTGNAVDICIISPSSSECKNSAFWAGVSWLNIGSSWLANTYQASRAVQVANQIINVGNVGADFLDISQSCGDGQFASGFGCVAAWGGLVFDVGQGGVDIIRAVNNNLSGLGNNIGSLPDPNIANNVRINYPVSPVTTIQKIAGIQDPTIINQIELTDVAPPPSLSVTAHNEIDLTPQQIAKLPVEEIENLDPAIAAQKSARNTTATSTTTGILGGIRTRWNNFVESNFNPLNWIGGNSPAIDLIATSDVVLPIGKSHQNDFFGGALDSGASRNHGEVRYNEADGSLIYIDKNSTNGTYYRESSNGEYIRLDPNKPLRITPQTEIRLGKNGLPFRIVNNGGVITLIDTSNIGVPKDTILLHTFERPDQSIIARNTEIISDSNKNEQFRNAFSEQDEVIVDGYRYVDGFMDSQGNLNIGRPPTDSNISYYPVRIGKKAFETAKGPDYYIIIDGETNTPDNIKALVKHTENALNLPPLNFAKPVEPANLNLRQKIAKAINDFLNPPLGAIEPNLTRWLNRNQPTVKPLSSINNPTNITEINFKPGDLINDDGDLLPIPQLLINDEPVGYVVYNRTTDEKSIPIMLKPDNKLIIPGNEVEISFGQFNKVGQFETFKTNSPVIFINSKEINLSIIMQNETIFTKASKIISNAVELLFTGKSPSTPTYPTPEIGMKVINVNDPALNIDPTIKDAIAEINNHGIVVLSSPNLGLGDPRIYGGNGGIVVGKAFLGKNTIAIHESTLSRGDTETLRVLFHEAYGHILGLQVPRDNIAHRIINEILAQRAASLKLTQLGIKADLSSFSNIPGFIERYRKLTGKDPYALLDIVINTPKIETSTGLVIIDRSPLFKSADQLIETSYYHPTQTTVKLTTGNVVIKKGIQLSPNDLDLLVRDSRVKKLIFGFSDDQGNIFTEAFNPNELDSVVRAIVGKTDARIQVELEGHNWDSLSQYGLGTKFDGSITVDVTDYSYPKIIDFNATVDYPFNRWIGEMLNRISEIDLNPLHLIGSGSPAGDIEEGKIVIIDEHFDKGIAATTIKNPLSKNDLRNLENGIELRSPIDTDGKLQLPFEKVTPKFNELDLSVPSEGRIGRIDPTVQFSKDYGQPIFDTRVSSEQIKIETRGDGVYITNLDSTTKTSVNNQDLSQNVPILIKEGDLISLSSGTTLKYKGIESFEARFELINSEQPQTQSLLQKFITGSESKFSLNKVTDGQQHVFHPNDQLVKTNGMVEKLPPKIINNKNVYYQITTGDINSLKDLSPIPLQDVNYLPNLETPYRINFGLLEDGKFQLLSDSPPTIFVNVNSIIDKTQISQELISRNPSILQKITSWFQDLSTQPNKIFGNISEISLIPNTTNTKQPLNQTPEFNRWFNNGFLVDEFNNPIVLYHGTTKDFAEFDLNKTGQTDPGLYGKAIYLTPDPILAESYTGSYTTSEQVPRDIIAPGSNIRPVYSNIKNPYIPEDLVKFHQEFGDYRAPGVAQKVADSLIKDGYDGIVVYKIDPTSVGKFLPEKIIEEVVVFDPVNIKSTFDALFSPSTLNSDVLNPQTLPPPQTKSNTFMDWFERLTNPNWFQRNILSPSGVWDGVKNGWNNFVESDWNPRNWGGGGSPARDISLSPDEVTVNVSNESPWQIINRSETEILNNNLPIKGKVVDLPQSNPETGLSTAIIYRSPQKGRVTIYRGIGDPATIFDQSASLLRGDPNNIELRIAVKNFADNPSPETFNSVKQLITDPEGMADLELVERNINRYMNEAGLTYKNALAYVHINSSEGPVDPGRISPYLSATLNLEVAAGKSHTRKGGIMVLSVPEEKLVRFDQYFPNNKEGEIAIKANLDLDEIVAFIPISSSSDFNPRLNPDFDNNLVNAAQFVDNQARAITQTDTLSPSAGVWDGVKKRWDESLLNWNNWGGGGSPAGDIVAVNTKNESGEISFTQTRELEATNIFENQPVLLTNNGLAAKGQNTNNNVIVNPYEDDWLKNVSSTIAEENHGVSKSEFFDRAYQQIKKMYPRSATDNERVIRTSLQNSDQPNGHMVGDVVLCGSYPLCFEKSAVLHVAGAIEGHESEIVSAFPLTKEISGHTWIEYTDSDGEYWVFDPNENFNIKRENAYEYYKFYYSLDVDHAKRAQYVVPNPNYKFQPSKKVDGIKPVSDTPSPTGFWDGVKKGGNTQGQTVVELSMVMPVVLAVPTVGLYYIDQYLDLGVTDYLLYSIDNALNNEQKPKRITDPAYDSINFWLNSAAVVYGLINDKELSEIAINNPNQRPYDEIIQEAIDNYETSNPNSNVYYSPNPRALSLTDVFKQLFSMDSVDIIYSTLSDENYKKANFTEKTMVLSENILTGRDKFIQSVAGAAGNIGLFTKEGGVYPIDGFYDEVTILTVLIEEEVKNTGKPVSHSFVLEYFLDKNNGDLAQAILDSSNFEEQLLRKRDGGLPDTYNWIQNHILDEYSHILPYQMLPTDEIKLENSEIYYDYSLPGRLGEVYHAANLTALLYYLPPEVIRAMTFSEYLSYGKKHGLIKLSADLEVLKELDDINNLLNSYQQPTP